MQQQQRKGRRKDRFFFLQVDTCANISIVGSRAVIERLTDIRKATKGQVVMMNSHPESIEAYGTLTCDLKDEATGEWMRLVLRDVAVVPGSSFNLLGWSAYKRQIANEMRSPGPLSLVFSGEKVHLPLSPCGSATGSQRGGLFSFRCRPIQARAHALINVEMPTMVKNEVEGDAPRMEEEEVEEKKERTEQPPNDHKATDSKTLSEEEAAKAAMIEKGAVIMAKARALMKMTHLKFGCMAKVGAIQAAIRRGDLRVNNAAVRNEMLRMEAKELECDSCSIAATNQKHPSAQNSVVRKGQWTMDGSGKYWRSRKGNRWAVVVVAPEGKGVFIVFMKHKSDLLRALQMNRRVWQLLVKEKMERLRMDRAAEQTSEKMTQYLAKHGIVPSFTAPNSSAGPAEAYIHLFQDGMMANLNTYAKLHNTQRPHHLWEYAFRYARDVKDMTPCSTNDGMSMYEKRTGEAPPLHKCHVWGATVTATLAKAARRKGRNRSKKARFLGFAVNGAGYVCYNPVTGKTFHSDSVRVFDNEAANAAPVEEAVVSDATDRDIAGQAKSYGQPLDNLSPQRVAQLREEQAAQPLDNLSPQHVGQLREEEAAPEDLEVDPEETDDEREHDPEQLAMARTPRKRNATSRMNVGHDEWQTLATHAPEPFSMRRAIQEDMAAERKKEELMRLKVKARTTRSFLRARQGPLPSGLVPQSTFEALNGDDWEIWTSAIKEETDGLEEREVMKKVKHEDMKKALDHGERLHVIGSKFVFDIKLRSPSCTLTGPCYRTLQDGRKVRYKARLVAKGFTQRPGVEYNIDEKYAPTPQIASIRLMLPHVFSKGWKMRQLDVKQAFLISELPESEQILMKPPPGTEPDGDYLWRLLRSLYGLMQAAHHWHREIKGTLLEHGFECIDADQGVYVRYDKRGDLLCALALHVDDCLVSAPDGILEEVTSNLKSTYKMSDQAADWFLKIKINDEHGRTLSLSQPAYAADIVKVAGMENANTVQTPMETHLVKGTELPFTEEESEFMANKYETYGTVVGMMSYLANGTRPDLSYSVGQVQLYTQFPRRHHWQALMRIVRYVKGTLNYGLLFQANGEKMIMGSCDSDHAGNTDDRTSTSGYVFTYLGTAFSWKSKKQCGKQQGRLRAGEEESDKRVTSDAARSSCESELRALDLATREALWLRKLGKALKIPSSETIPVHEDNEAAYYIAKGSKWSAETKHVATMYYAVRDDIMDKRIDLRPIASKDNMSDMFTKPLKRVLFERFRLAMGVCDVGST